MRVPSWTIPAQKWLGWVGATSRFEMWQKRGMGAMGAWLCLSQAPKDELGILQEVRKGFQGKTN